MPKASATGITLQFGLMSVTGALYATVGERAQDGGAKTVRLTSCCPTCKDEDGVAVKTHTVHTCPKEHGPFPASDVLKATGSGKNLTIVTDAETATTARKEAAAETGPGLVCNLTPYPADEVLACTFPIGTPWVFEPTTAGQAMDLLRSEIGEDMRVGDVVLLGEVQLRADAPAKFVSLRTRNGQLLVQEMARPENVHSFTAPEVNDVPEAVRAQFTQLLSLTKQDFDHTEHRSAAADRVADFVSNLTGGAKILTLSPVSDEPEPALDLSAQLEAMLAAAKSA
jgi:hypothetical protein